jgi:hypothetical protein
MKDVLARPSDKGRLEGKVQLWKVKKIRCCEGDIGEHSREGKMSTSDDFYVWRSLF